MMTSLSVVILGVRHGSLINFKEIKLISLVCIFFLLLMYKTGKMLAIPRK